MQQDVQEFNSLFLPWLGSLLKKSAAPGLVGAPDLVPQNLVSKLFQGRLSYVTTCHNCNRNSPRESSFFDLCLQIRGHSSTVLRNSVVSTCRSTASMPHDPQANPPCKTAWCGLPVAHACLLLLCLCVCASMFL